MNIKNIILIIVFFVTLLNNVKAEPPKIIYNKKKPIEIININEPIKDDEENTYTIKVEYDKNKKNTGKPKSEAFQIAMEILTDEITSEFKNEYELEIIDIWDKDDSNMIISVKYHKLEKN